MAQSSEGGARAAWGPCRRRGPGVPWALAHLDWQLAGGTRAAPGSQEGELGKCSVDRQARPCQQVVRHPSVGPTFLQHLLPPGLGTKSRAVAHTSSLRQDVLSRQPCHDGLRPLLLLGPVCAGQCPSRSPGLTCWPVVPEPAPWDPGHCPGGQAPRVAAEVTCSWKESASSRTGVARGRAVVPLGCLGPRRAGGAGLHLGLGQQGRLDPGRPVLVRKQGSRTVSSEALERPWVGQGSSQEKTALRAPTACISLPGCFLTEAGERVGNAAPHGACRAGAASTWVPGWSVGCGHRCTSSFWVPGRPLVTLGQLLAFLSLSSFIQKMQPIERSIVLWLKHKARTWSET